jgi:hypothetical protein
MKDRGRAGIQIVLVMVARISVFASVHALHGIATSCVVNAKRLIRLTAYRVRGGSRFRHSTRDNLLADYMICC